jgi:hypothetical protein
VKLKINDRYYECMLGVQNGVEGVLLHVYMNRESAVSFIFVLSDEESADIDAYLRLIIDNRSAFRGVLDAANGMKQ